MFQATEYGAVVSSAPRSAPSSRNCTPTTPTLSDALAVTFTEPDTVAPAAGAVSATVGGTLSGAGGLTGVAMSVWISATANARLYTRTSSIVPPRKSVFDAPVIHEPNCSWPEKAGSATFCVAPCWTPFT